MRIPALLFSVLLSVLTLLAPAHAVQPPTMRLDYYHTGNATIETFSFDRVVIEPLPWPGDMSKAIDDTNLGNYFFEVRDASSDKLLYSRGFGSIFSEWSDTEEAKRLNRTFSESLRFPAPSAPVKIVFTRYEKFCAVCQRSIERIISLYAACSSPEDGSIRAPRSSRLRRRRICRRQADVLLARVREGLLSGRTRGVREEPSSESGIDQGQESRGQSGTTNRETSSSGKKAWVEVDMFKGSF